MEKNKRAVCIGINDYPGTQNNLKGCVNDAKDWAALLRTFFGFKDIALITNADAAKANILSAFTNLVTNAGPGDVLVFTYSGHGTWVLDRGERDEPDNRDEILYVYDGNLSDSDFRSIIGRIDPEAHLTVICDSCYWGTFTREILERQPEIDKEAEKFVLRPRFMPPPYAILTSSIPFRQRFFYPEPDIPWVLLTGCNTFQSSYDAYINDRFNGVMTVIAVRLIKINPRQTYLELHQKLRRELPSSYYPQSPQLVGSEKNKNRPLFT
jgi:hypothetical protein